MLKNKVLKKLEIMCEGKDLGEIYVDLKKLLIALFSNNIYIGSRQYISIESEDIIKVFSENYINECIEKFNEYFIDYINKESEKLSQNLLDFQNNFNIIFNGIM